MRRPNARWVSRWLYALLILGSLSASTISQARKPLYGQSTKSSAGPRRGVSLVESRPAFSPQQTGPYYALVIGINNYRHMPKLETAVNDAKGIEKILRDKYGFQTELLLNATRHQIMRAVSEYRRTLPENANLLVYYAGHGQYDREGDKAYWLPVDAEPDSSANWIIADDITTSVKVIPAKHVLIISDSCYSGGITRDAPMAVSPRERGRYLQKMMSGKSRTLMSSGGNEPVADAGSAGHSVFANALLQGFAQMDEEVFTAENLFHEFIRVRVAGKSDQTPQYNPIRNSGHDDGDFVFTRKKETAGSRRPSSVAPPPVNPEPQPRYSVSGTPPSSSATPAEPREPLGLVKSIPFNAQDGWTNTFLTVPRGAQVEIKASGQVDLGRYGVADPAGTEKLDDKRPVKSCPTGALIARIGESDPVCIQRSHKFNAPSAGVLYLGFNSGNPKNNRGSVVANINID